MNGEGVGGRLGHVKEKYEIQQRDGALGTENYEIEKRDVVPRGHLYNAREAAQVGEKEAGPVLQKVGGALPHLPQGFAALQHLQKRRHRVMRHRAASFWLVEIQRREHVRETNPWFSNLASVFLYSSQKHCFKSKSR